MIKIGLGYDVHKLVSERPLIIGAVNIPHSKGLLGHSDADVLIHAIMDSLLGPSGLGDIGKLFPDTNQIYKDVSSLELLAKVTQKLKKQKITIVNIDCVIMAERPKLAPYIQEMQNKIAQTLEIPVYAVTIKATTTEKLGFVGREEGIAAQAVSLLEL